MPKVCPVCNTTYPDTNAFCPADGTTLRATDLDGDLIGSVVADRYLVTDLIGEGGMGKVYLARHVRIPQQAAIKVLRPELVSDPGALARFTREASSASQIDDEHVARVYDFGETGAGTVYIAMEYVAGRTLREIVVADGPLAPQRTASLVRQIAEGLDAAHRLHIIHRDLKPDNILIVAGSRGRERVKVVDFGIAKAVGADDGKLTKTGFVVGTPEFMSPEQLLGEPLDARSDVYALALVAYQCLTGMLPFELRTPTARLTETPRPLDVVRPDVAWPAPLQTVFDHTLSREPDGRPESAGAFASELTAAIDVVWPDEQPRASHPPAAPAAPPQATPPVAVAHPSPPLPPLPARRLPVWPAAAVVVALIGVGALWVRRGERPASADSTVVATSSRVPVVDSAPRPAAIAPTRTETAARPDRRPTPVATGAPRTVQRDAPPAAVSVAESDRQYAARVTLDSLAGVLHRGAVDASTARTVARAIRELVPELARDDRVRAQIRLIEASALSGDLAAACEALRVARASATTAEQRADIRKYDEQLGCG